MFRRLTISLLGSLAALALAAPASAEFTLERTYGNGKVFAVGLGPTHVAWAEWAVYDPSRPFSLQCVRWASLAIPGGTQRTLWCSTSFNGVAVSERYIVAAETTPNHGLHVYDLATAQESFLGTLGAPYGLRIDGTRIVFFEQSKLISRNLATGSERVLSTTAACADVSGSSVVWLGGGSVYSWDGTQQRKLSRPLPGIANPNYGCPRVSGALVRYQVYKSYDTRMEIKTYVDARSHTFVRDHRGGATLMFDFDGPIGAQVTQRQYAAPNVFSMGGGQWELPLTHRFAALEVSELRAAVIWKYNPDPLFGFVTIGRIS